MHSRQRGAFAVAFAIFMLAIIGFISLSMDLAQVYVRQTEMQGAADAAAVAAARELNGTMPGVAAARSKAEQVFSSNTYSYWDPLPWSAEIMSFAPTAEGAWIPDAAVNASNVGTLRFVRIDTAAGSADPGIVQMTFNAGATLAVRKQAVAGPTSMQAIPLAVCAMGTEQASRPLAGSTALEKVEYGFRRGVTYNLLNLNPTGPTPLSYLVNPVDFPPAVSRLIHFDRQYVGPFACSGTMPFPPSGKLHVMQGFPSRLAAELNSRFGDYTGNHCVPGAAPPDKNIRQYSRAVADYWMKAEPVTTQAGGYAWSGLRTVADAPNETVGGDPRQFGVLWAYARPVSTTDASFGKNDWDNLYRTSSGTYPESTFSDFQKTPYFSWATPSPSPSAVRYRRVMGVPLISCPVPASGEATVLAIGKFMLSEKAVDDPVNPVIAAEFGGLLDAWGPAISAGMYK